MFILFCNTFTRSSGVLFAFTMELDSFLPLNDVIFNYYFLIGGFFLSYLIYKLLYSLLSGKSYMRTRYRSCGHSWRSIQCNKSIPYSIYVSIPAIGNLLPGWLVTATCPYLSSINLNVRMQLPK